MSNKIYGFRPPERPAFPSHIQYTGDNQLLSAPEIKSVVDWCDAQELQPGTIGTGGTKEDVRMNQAYRDVETCGVIDPQFTWLYDRIAQRIQWANDEHYRFILTGMAEPFNYLKYTPASEDKPTPGHYGWHQDWGGGRFSWRKLTLVIQLSSPDEYTGCELVACTDEGPFTVPYKEAGDAILFPSWTPHRVTEIESGVRRSMALWFTGPQFS